MRLDFAFLCDAATESGGKVNALGVGIERLQVRRLPARHGRLCLVARVSFDVDDAGAHPFVIRVIDADGGDVVREVKGEMRLSSPSGAAPAKANLLVDIVNAEFRTPGPHEVTLSVGSDVTATLPLDVTATEAG